MERGHCRGGQDGVKSFCMKSGTAAAGGLSKSAAAAAAKGIAEGIEDGMAEGKVKGIAVAIPEGIAEGIAEEIPEGIAGGIARTTVAGIAEAIAGCCANSRVVGRSTGRAMGWMGGRSIGGNAPDRRNDLMGAALGEAVRSMTFVVGTTCAASRVSTVPRITTGPSDITLMSPPLP